MNSQPSQLYRPNTSANHARTNPIGVILLFSFALTCLVSLGMKSSMAHRAEGKLAGLASYIQSK